MDKQGQLRWGWRIAGTILLTVLVLILTLLILGPIAKKEQFPIFHLAMIIATVLAILIEKRKWREVGLTKLTSKTIGQFIAGFLLALVSCVIMLIALVFTGEMSFKNFNLIKLIDDVGVTGLIYWLLVGTGEEILFRGYMLNTLPVNYHFWVRNVIVGLLFSMIHIVNPSYNSFIIFLIAFGFGLFFGWLYHITGTLWFCIGFHISWDYFQTVFKIPDNGWIIYLVAGIVLILNIVIIIIYRSGAAIEED